MKATKVDHLKVGGRVLRVGDQVKVNGLRGLFTIKSFTAGEVELYGGPLGGVRMYRTVAADRIGVRKVLAAS